MKIEITNRIGKPAEAHLNKFKTRFPPFAFSKEKNYNGVVIEIDDDDCDDFLDALEAAGFDYNSEHEASGVKPKHEKNAPRFPKAAPKFPKAKPTLTKVIPKLPRSL